MPVGTIQDCENFEVGTVRGLTQIAGFERYDGQLSPSNITDFWVIRITGVAVAFNYGVIVTWGTVGDNGTGMVLFTTDEVIDGQNYFYIGLTFITGRLPQTGDIITSEGIDLGINLIDGEWIGYPSTLEPQLVQTTSGDGTPLTWGDGTPIESLELLPASQDTLNAQIAAAASQYRSVVEAIPGGELSRIPGLFFLSGKVYAITDMLGIAFTAGNATGLTLVDGVAISQGAFPDTPTLLGYFVSAVVESGSWETGDAVGYIVVRPVGNSTPALSRLNVGDAIGAPQFAVATGESTGNRANLWFTTHNEDTGWQFFDNMPRQIGFKQDSTVPTVPSAFFKPYERPGLSSELTTPTDTGTIDPLSATSNPTLGWTAPDNVLLDDGVYTTCGMGLPINTVGPELLVLFDFSTLIPVAATVLGIEVTIKRYYTQTVSGTGFVIDNEVTLIGVSGAVQNKANVAASWPENIGSVATATYGGSIDKWGNACITDEIINPDSFGVKIRSGVSGAVPGTVYSAFIDVVTCKVYFQPQTSKVYIRDVNSPDPTDVEATVIHRVVENGDVGGSITANNAEGVAFLTFDVKNRAVGSGEQFRTGPGGTGSIIALTTSTDTQFTLPSSYAIGERRYQSALSSPYPGGQDIVIIVNGTERACLFDGTNLVPLGTGLTTDLETPSHVAFAGTQAALGYPNGSVEVSELGNPAIFGTATNGSLSLQFTGGSVVGLQRMVGDVMGVWTKRNIESYDFATDLQREIAPSARTIEYTVVDVGQPVFTDIRGIGGLAAVLAYGDFAEGKFSEKISNILFNRLQNPIQTSDQRPLCAYPNRSSNQYRLLFRDGYQLTATFIGEAPQFTWQRFYVDSAEDPTKQIRVLGLCTAVTESGEDVVFFTMANHRFRYVFRMSIGRTFDGAAIKAWFTLNPVIAGGPSDHNAWTSVFAYGTAYGYATVNTKLAKNFTVPTSTSPGGTYSFGASNANATSVPVPVRNEMTLSAAGSGMDVTIRIQSENPTQGAYTVQAMQIIYTAQGTQRK